jgi:hypothetical protein
LSYGPPILRRGRTITGFFGRTIYPVSSLWTLKPSSPVAAR